MNPLEEVLKEISSKPNLNKENIIYEVKNALQAKDPGAYDEWKEDGFNVDHVFYGKDALLHLAAEYGNIEMAEALIKLKIFRRGSMAIISGLKLFSSREFFISSISSQKYSALKKIRISLSTF